MAVINVNELVKQKEYDFLRKEKQLGDNIIFLVVAGSHAYGLSTPDSDVDVRGVALETPEHFLDSIILNLIMMNLQIQ